MKALSRNRFASPWLLLLTFGLPLVVLGIGWLVTGALSAGVIAASAVSATLVQIALALWTDIATVREIEFELYQDTARIRRTQLLEREERHDRLQAAAYLHDSVINTLCAVSLRSSRANNAESGVQNPVAQSSISATYRANAVEIPGQESSLAATLTSDLDDIGELQQRCQHDLDSMQAYLAEAAEADKSVTGRPRTLADWCRWLAACVAEQSQKLDLDVELLVPIIDQVPNIDQGYAAQPEVGYEVDHAGTKALELAVREALTNVAKHSQTKRAVVELQSEPAFALTVTESAVPLAANEPATFRISVTDQGAGWPTQVVPEITEFSLFQLGAGVQTAVANNWPAASSERQLANPTDYQPATDMGGVTVMIQPTATRVEPTQNLLLAVQDAVEVPLFRTVNFWLVGLCILVMAMFFDTFSPLWWLFAAVLTVSASMTMTNLKTLGFGHDQESNRCSVGLNTALVASVGILIASPILLGPPALGHWLAVVPASVLLVTASWVLPSYRWVLASLGSMILGALLLAWWQLAVAGVAGANAISAGAVGAVNLAGAGDTNQLVSAGDANQLVSAANPAINLITAATLVGVTTVVATGIVVATFWARRVIDESTKRSELELAQVASEIDQEQLAGRRGAIRQQLIGRCMAVAEPILAGIATGTIELNPTTNAQIRRVERLLRSAIALGREQDQVSTFLFDLLWDAYDRDIELQVLSYRTNPTNPTSPTSRINPTSPTDPSIRINRRTSSNSQVELDQLAADLTLLVDSLPPQSTIRVSTYETSAGLTLLVVADAPGADHTQIHEFELGIASHQAQVHLH